ncbi:MAG: hypothetical protein L3J03_00280 [Desulfobacterales bacterium]|nr:hypothetical protein [Desulfobacterales bacterium]
MIHRFLKNKKMFALAGDTGGAILAEITRSAQKEPILTMLGNTNGVAVTNKTSMHRLLSRVPETSQGELSMALPLSFFTTKNITLPAMPREAINQALPYHLAKVVDQPLKDLLYDWQISQRLKGQLVVTVYLFQRKSFEMFRRELGEKKLELTFFESDVFAAFGLLDRQGRLRTGKSSLCLLIWNRSISIAIHEKNVLTVVRSVPLARPATPYSAAAVRQSATAGPAQTITPPPLPAPGKEFIDDSAMDAILLNFDILKHGSTDPAPADKKAGAAPGDNGPGTATSDPVAKGTWYDYLQQISLELIRTRDYYGSVVKGSPVSQLFAGGADDFFKELQDIVRTSMDLAVEPLLGEEQLPAGCPPSYGAICIGTGARW